MYLTDPKLVRGVWYLVTQTQETLSQTKIGNRETDFFFSSFFIHYYINFIYRFHEMTQKLIFVSNTYITDSFKVIGQRLEVFT